MYFLPASAEARPAFVMNSVNEPASLDPSLAPSDAEYRVLDALFEGLATTDPFTCRPIPALARSWELSPDGTSYLFTLREGIQWSDGTPITAATFRDSWLRTLAPETAAPYAYLMYSIIDGAKEYNAGKAGPEQVGIDVLDDRRLRLRMPAAVPWALDLLASFYFDALPMHAIARHGDQWVKAGNMVCSGPFILQEWIPGDRIIVRANPRYWDAAAVGLSSIEFRFIPDASLAYKLYATGEIDWLIAPPLDLMPEIKLREDFHARSIPSTQMLYVNARRPPLGDARVRRALSLAIDREALCSAILGGVGKPASVLVPDLPGYRSQPGGGRDVEAARALLAQAGYPGGKGFPELGYLCGTSSTQKRIGEFLQSQWREALGIKVRIDQMEFRVLVSFRASGQFDLARAGWFNDYPDPVNFLELFDSTDPEVGSGASQSSWSNARFDSLLAASRTMSAGEARYATLREAEAVLVGPEQGVIPLYFESSAHLVDTGKWAGWSANPLDLHPWKFVRRRR